MVDDRRLALTTPIAAIPKISISATLGPLLNLKTAPEGSLKHLGTPGWELRDGNSGRELRDTQYLSTLGELRDTQYLSTLG